MFDHICNTKMHVANNDSVPFYTYRYEHPLYSIGYGYMVRKTFNCDKSISARCSLHWSISGHT
uniref:Uncharacterized protein n=1 Tax=Daphnia magna TaxID=35525 RepID=A0A0P6AIN3_9CRUS